jgi:hypothetical protein
LPEREYLIDGASAWSKPSLIFSQQGVDGRAKALQ